MHWPYLCPSVPRPYSSYSLEDAYRKYKEKSAHNLCQYKKKALVETHIGFKYPFVISNKD